MKQCLECQQVKPLTEFYRKTSKRASQHYMSWCKECFATRKGRRRDLNKQMAVEYMDGRCAVCGYDRSIQALEFHHLNPSIKVGNSHAFIREWGWERVKQQLDSCVMLCANCHREVEAGITKLD